jgi:hypothetical protein
MSSENTYKNLKKEEKQEAVMKELLPFAIFTAIPIIITLMIAFVFGPSSFSNF